jgi:hypothetical protein
MVALGTPVGDRQIGDTVVGDVSLVHVAEAELVLVCDVGGAALVDVADVRVERLDPVDGAVPIGRGRIDDAAAIAYLPSDATALRGVPIHDRGLVLAAATAAGVAAGATAVAVEYAKQREQFGKPIGAFQAIKHRCADMAVAAEGAFAQTCYAAVALRDGVTGAGTEAAVAKYHADVAAQLAASGAVQVHGAIGFTSEALPHRYVYRANLLRTLLSGRAELLDRVLDRPAEVT